MTVYELLQLLKDTNRIDPDWQVFIAEPDTALLTAKPVMDVVITSIDSQVLLPDRPIVKVVLRGGSQ